MYIGKEKAMAGGAEDSFTPFQQFQNIFPTTVFEKEKFWKQNFYCQKWQFCQVNAFQ